ncbi:CECR1 [Lepeophtheirus salmonis]|uniref:Adenosine deaminase n=1 Tax=Lepeophtheirus salmonis TaxID=72036 RepID=A0A817FCR8_LEPSM|nr:CECR1 [Lepeophtheirus salmonis]CAG9477573.1 CECR1 [Lepeophtheirus salmonis]
MIHQEKNDKKKTNLIWELISKLNAQEKAANSTLMEFKIQELEMGFQSPSSYNPSNSFFNRIQEIEESNVYKFIENSHWILLSELRNKFSAEKVDQWLMKHLDIRVNNPYEEYSDIDKVWTAFLNVMLTIENLLSYAPIYDRYFYEGLSEFEKNGVSYIEIRTLFPENICEDLQCSKTLSTIEVAKLNQKTIDRFLKDHPNFCGVTLIYAPIRLRECFPNLVRGFDLVAQEDNGKPLIEFINTLIQMKQMDPELKFVFHAGETNWQGFSTDENLIDAILLNTTRIGHGYALLKHPILKKLVAEKNIAIETCPISNQVLGLVKDIRNHPASPLIAEGSTPLVISSDDPGSWGANGVSFDYYEAFMGLAGKHMDLRLLKQLFNNSISYSLLKPQEKEQCFNKFRNKWNNFMERL